MTNDVLTFGLNHVSAPVEVRERVAFPMDVLRSALEGIRSTFGSSVSEAAILSTCNRTEIYCAAEPHVVEHLPKWMAEFNEVRSTDLTPHLRSEERRVGKECKSRRSGRDTSWPRDCSSDVCSSDLMDVLRSALEGIRSTFGSSVSEAAILSTCNRTEIYCAAEPHVVEHLPKWMAEFNEVRATDLTPHLYRYEHNQAVRHAFRLASGLDSMVLGEAQILGQMKDAVRAADEAGALGTLLHQLFQRTFSVAKEVRTQTAIGAHSVSMAAAAVRLAERVFGDLGQTNVLFIGAGEMIELCAAHFATQKPKKMMVANRTRERAEGLASRFHANTMRLADLPENLERYDVVVSSTASTLPILGLGMVERAIKARRHRPIVRVGLAVPRDR